MDLHSSLAVIATPELAQLIETITSRVINTALSQFTQPAQTKPSEALTFDQCRTRLKLSAPTLRALLVSGKLRGVRAGKRWLVPSDEVERFLRGDA